MRCDVIRNRETASVAPESLKEEINTMFGILSSLFQFRCEQKNGFRALGGGRGEGVLGKVLDWEKRAFQRQRGLGALVACSRR